MIRFKHLALSILLGMSSLSAQSADDVIQKTVDALGGAEKLRSVKSRLLVGEALLGGGVVSGDFRWLTLRPNYLKIEITVGDQMFVQAHDGKASWQIQPTQFGGSGQVEILAGPAAESVERSAVFESALLDYRKKGHKAELLDPDDVRGKPAYHIKMTLASGVVNEYFIDKETYYPVKIVSTRFNPQTGGDVTVEQFATHYKAVSGIQIAHTLETYSGGQAINEFKVSEAEVDLETSAGDFKPPSS